MQPLIGNEPLTHTEMFDTLSLSPDWQYNQVIKAVLKHGETKPSRAGDTVSLFGLSMGFDLQHSFPLLSGKKINFDMVYAELMWFLRGESNINTLRYPQLWKDWADSEGDNGPIYGAIWRKLTKYFLVPPVVVPKDDQRIESGLSKEIVLDFSSNENAYVGKTFTSNSCGDFVVIREYRVPRDIEAQSKVVFDVQFVDSGFINKGVPKQSIENRSIADSFYPSACGVGCMGSIDADTDELRMLKETWNGLLKRCYVETHQAFSKYGGSGVFVCKRWLVFANFVEDARKLENWLCKKEYPDEFTLDKDFYASNCYSPGTCIWASKTEQSINTENIRLFKAITPTGEVSKHIGVKPFARMMNLNAQKISEVLSGKIRSYKEWQFEPLVAPEGAVPRIRVYDQLKTLIATLKHNPNDRRMLVSAWSVPDFANMSLNPCHSFFQCYVREGKYLDLCLWQRSCDLAIGVPFNIASYALLTHLLARETDLLPGRFTHFLGDAHIYTQHIENLETQIIRPLLKAPQLKLRGTGDIWEYAKRDTPDDYELLGYEPHKFIKFEINV